MLFTFPSRYLFAIGRQRVLRLGGWSPHVRTGLHVSRPTRVRCSALRVRGCHPLRPGFPDRFHLSSHRRWPSPLSLATTRGVSVDVLSSRYLDVSVPWVCFLSLWIRDKIPSSDNQKSETTCAAPRMPLGIRAATHMTSKFWLSKVGCPIRRSTDQRSFAPPRSLSQRTTSFIACCRQGIRQMPLGRLIALINNAHRVLHPLAGTLNSAR